MESMAMSTTSSSLAVGEPAAAAGTTAASPTDAAPAGFLALIGALLQESAPALIAATATTGASEIPTPVVTDDDDSADGADAAALLAALAFSQGAIVNAPRPAGAGASAGDPAPDGAAVAVDVESAARRSLAVGTKTGEAAPAMVGDLADGATAGAHAATTQTRGPQSRDGLSALSQSVGALFAPVDGAVDTLAGREEGASPRSAVTAAASTSPSPGTLLTTVANLVNGDAALTRGTPATPESPICEQLGTPRWQEEIGNRITLMAAQGQHSGSLRLNPEHLGPVEVQITVGDDRTNVQFGAQNADTRQALNDALPRLREMFASAGLQLGQAGVSHHAPRQRSDNTFGASADRIAARSDGEPTPLAAPVQRITHSGLLDTYA